MTCKPCQENAVLTVGDRICHRISTHSNIDCHGLVHKVKEKRMTVHDYVSALESKADETEKGYIRELRKLYE